KEAGETGDADRAAVEAELFKPFDRVLRPLVTAVAHIPDPALHALPPSRAVEDVGGRLAFARKNGEDFRREATDRAQVARIGLELLPAAAVRRQQENVDAASRHLVADIAIPAISLFERELRNQIGFHYSTLKLVFFPAELLNAFG